MFSGTFTRDECVKNTIFINIGRALRSSLLFTSSLDRDLGTKRLRSLNVRLVGQALKAKYF